MEIIVVQGPWALISLQKTLKPFTAAPPFQLGAAHVSWKLCCPTSVTLGAVLGAAGGTGRVRTIADAGLTTPKPMLFIAATAQE